MITLKELIYSKEFSGKTKFRLLRMIEGDYWVEDLLDLLKEYDEMVETKTHIIEEWKEEWMKGVASVGGIKIPVDVK